MLICSLFPGVGIFDRGFEAEDFSIVRGSPCQDFSAARRAPPTGLGKKLMREFGRVVREARPEWWLLENVPGAPNLDIRGYNHQRIDVEQGWYCGVSRLRYFQFGSRSGRSINVPIGRKRANLKRAALANDDRSFAELCRLQGLPPDRPSVTDLANLP